MGKILDFFADLAKNWFGALFLPTMKIGILKLRIFPFFDPILTLDGATGVCIGQTKVDQSQSKYENNPKFFFYNRNIQYGVGCHVLVQGVLL